MRIMAFCVLVATPLFALVPDMLFPARSIVIRHDVSADDYLSHETPSALVDMRHQGHGVLIAPEWVVTAAHLVFYDYKDKTITIGGVERSIDYVIFHPGFSKPSEGLFTGYSGPAQAYLRANHDIALVKLKKAVEGVAPMPLYRSNAEEGEVFTLFGKGNTGDGLTGQVEKTDGALRRAQNTVSEAQDQWLFYQFNRGEEALPLEGIQGDGDSGGPAVISVNGVDTLIGLVSWDVYDGDIAEFQGGLYGMEASLIRISYYEDWIDDIMTWSRSELKANHNKIHE